MPAYPVFSAWIQSSIGSLDLLVPLAGLSYMMYESVQYVRKTPQSKTRKLLRRTLQTSLTCMAALMSIFRHVGTSRQ